MGEALRADSRSDAQLAAIVQSSDDAIIAKDLDGTIVSWNPGAEGIYGYRADEVVGQPMSILVPPEKSDELATMLEGIARGEHVNQFETVRLRKDGQRIDVSLTVSPIRNAEGAPIGASTIAREVTARNAADRRTRALTAELQRSNIALEQFAYAASHDLSEPLRAIGGFANLLAQRYQGQLDERGQGYIQRVGDGVRRLDALIEGLLAYSRVGTASLERAPVSCDEIFGGAVEALAERIESTSAEVTADPLPTLRADPALLGQVFQNLISNAIKFGAPEGPRVHVSAAEEDGGWRFSVRDNGIGIEPRHAQRIFRIFQRLHTRDEYPGAGIGLAVCQAIVDRHGGEIQVEPAPGGGSVLAFTIPDGDGKL